ncbi:diguanylate cyclase/phosphodiesterase (GGDEF & EAL domains) with PAS/PAC sensor(s) [Labilithrix luteola]|uniref:histidine kinase n=1 Tax=Labilithrix luteola TaxID=1391654 RepID=A0A0K1PUW1_9BACT|nr:PAS domain S-box protein [Labilithrix luteola]AKU96919.1 diguanylate cyclase/phosphodiesterase (GGDEF & EAL domains) with PAS/PAC sensor(s) [Labilithrix luteola]
MQSELLADWSKRVSDDREVRRAAQLVEPMLNGHLPILIDELAERLERGPHSAAKRKDAFEEREAESYTRRTRPRLHDFSTADEVLREWTHFRLALVELLHREGVSPTSEEYKVIFQRIDEAAVATAIELQRRATAALAGSEHRHRALVDSIHDGVIMLDSNGSILTWSEASSRITGYTAEELVGKHVSILYESEDVLMGEPDRALKDAADLGHHESWGWRVRKDGVRFWADVVMRPVRDLEGALVGYATVIRDLSEQKRRMDELEYRAAELGAILESIPDGLFVLTLDGVTRANRRGLEMLGIGSIEEINANLHNLTTRLKLRDTETGRPLRNQDLRLLSALVGETVTAEAIARRVDNGEDCIIKASAAPIRTRERVAGAVVITTDITTDYTQRKQLREEMELVDRFIAILGHDLRNPLSAISSGAELLLHRKALSDENERIVRRMVSSTHRMARIIEQLLDWTRSRRGGIPIERKPADLGIVCNEVIAEIEAAHPRRTIRVIREGNLVGHWDVDRIAQALSNLVGNAIVHSPADAPVTVRLLGTSDDVRLQVNNAGPSIPSDVVPTLFEPFRRLDLSHSVGLGLGLYIVRAIARAHGGSIDVESNAERGTTFSIVIPRT